MQKAIPNLVLGLFVGMSATALLGMALFFSIKKSAALPPVSTPLPSPTISFLPSVRPSATPSPLPVALASPIATIARATPTVDAVQALMDAGGFVFSGPLSHDEQRALYKASLKYIAVDVADSRRISKQLNGVGYGDPTNICGPLAAAILRDAGLMDPEILPHDFWLLNPYATSDQALLQRVFPPERFEHSRTKIPINKIDWRTSPLQPGDFLFIWHGTGGNFDHMLVVTRVDSAMRAYAVTNYGTLAGFVIAEALLYDPGDPSAGLFHTWTKEQNAILGSTGFGGFELWRRIGP